jgi:hypothetical protein
MTFIKRNCVFRNCLSVRKQYISHNVIYIDIYLIFQILRFEEKFANKHFAIESTDD